ncbi:helix-turn-helix domain-containing protein [Shimia sp.]|uniref:AraC family transcriptional regulator n=1 Tax=Shimia sp. TaxID=1954381 RepID=UPI003BA95B61
MNDPNNDTAPIVPELLAEQFILPVEGSLARSDVRQFELLFDLIPDIYFYIKGTTGRWVTCNIASLRLLSLTKRHEIFGAREESFFPPQIADAIKQDDLNVIRNQRRIINKFELIADERGQLIWVVTNKLPILSTNGEALGLAGVTRILPESRALPGPLERFRVVVASIENNIAQPIKVPELAAMAGMSESHFRRRFKAAFGVSAQEFILRTRLLAASRMIANSADPFSVISLRCGFSDQSYFTRQFVRFFGQSPKRYRLRWRSS